MKKIILVLSFLILTNFANGQWYFKQYQIKDINQLSKVQLDESLKNSREAQFTSLISVGLGAGFLLANKYGLWESDTNPSDFEKFIGRKSLHDIYAVIGISFLAGGTIAFVGYLERSKNIRIAIHRNFPNLGILQLSPTIIYTNYSSSGNFGLALNLNF
ncbi:MAG: hypothetical protein WCJ95_04450 [Mariniphaga sp.]